MSKECQGLEAPPNSERRPREVGFVWLRFFRDFTANSARFLLKMWHLAPSARFFGSVSGHSLRISRLSLSTLMTCGESWLKLAREISTGGPPHFRGLCTPFLRPITCISLILRHITDVSPDVFRHRLFAFCIAASERVGPFIWPTPLCSGGVLATELTGCSGVHDIRGEAVAARVDRIIHAIFNGYNERQEWRNRTLRLYTSSMTSPTHYRDPLPGLVFAAGSDVCCAT